MKANRTLIPLAILLLASCGGKKAATSETDSLQEDNSLSEMIIHHETDTIPSDSLPDFLSSDLHKFSLKGPVKEVAPQDYASFVSCVTGRLNFDKEGNLTSSFSDLTDNHIDLSPDSLVSKTYARESDGTTFVLQFSEWDENSNPVAGKYISDGPAEIWEVNFTISYDKFDPKGNWLARTFKGESITRSATDDGEYGDPQKEKYTQTETRRISYH